MRRLMKFYCKTSRGLNEQTRCKGENIREDTGSGEPEGTENEVEELSSSSGQRRTKEKRYGVGLFRRVLSG